MYRPATILGCLVALAAAAGLFFTGDIQGKLMFDQQPMKMASAESLCHTETDPDFSVLTIGTHNNCDSVTHVIEVPYVLPFLAEGKFTGVTLQGVKDLQEQYQEKFGPGDYRPNLFVTYWAFRAMIGLLVVPVAFALVALWLTRRGRIPDQRWFGWFALITLPTPFLANRAGWVFTEMGRQPWVVVPNPTGDQMVRLTVQKACPTTRRGWWCSRWSIFTAPLRSAGGHLVLADPPLRRRGTAGTRLRTRAARAARATTTWRPCRSRTERRSSMGLQELWFLLIAALFLGFFVLEGFDFGVGMLMGPSAASGKGDPESTAGAQR